MSHLFESDSDPEFQPKRLKLEETFPKKPTKSYLKEGDQFPDDFDEDELLGDEDDEQQYDDNDHENLLDDEDLLEDEGEEYNSTHDLDEDDFIDQTFQPKSIKINESLQMKPTKSCLKKANRLTSDFNGDKLLRGKENEKLLKDEGGKYDSTDDEDEKEKDERKASLEPNQNEKFVVRTDGEIVAGFTGLYEPKHLTDKEFKQIEERRHELGELHPPFKGVRNDAVNRYHKIKSQTHEDNNKNWCESHSSRISLRTAADKKRLHAEKVRNYYGKENYLKQLNKRI